MKPAPVVQLKSQLSRYLRRVKAGEEILVTERGVPIARIVPIGKRDETLESLRDLERQGLMRLGSGKLSKDFWRLPRSRDPQALVRQAVIAEREEGR